MSRGVLALPSVPRGLQSGGLGHAGLYQGKRPGSFNPVFLFS